MAKQTVAERLYYIEQSSNGVWIHADFPSRTMCLPVTATEARNLRDLLLLMFPLPKEST